jgi:hypothetical protein
MRRGSQGRRIDRAVYNPGAHTHDRGVFRCIHKPKNTAVTALNSADTPQQPNPDLLLQY